MTIRDRVRTYLAVWSMVFNQTVHLGGAPYPLTFSETCFIRDGQRRYRYARIAIDTFFRLLGERNHCANAFAAGVLARRALT